MNAAVDIRDLDEWMYALNTAAEQLDADADAEALRLVRQAVDEMREKRAELELRRHNETGY